MNKDSAAERIVSVILIILLAVSFVLLMFPCIYAMKGLDYIIPDGYVFKYIGIQMTKGQMPYLDVFDHKGPLLYVINFLGVIINRDFGIIIVEAIFNIVSIVLLCIIPLRIGCSKMQALFTALIATLFYISVFKPGNYVEEFALPFILASYLIFIDYFKHDMINTKRLIINGACFGAVIMLRPNMACLWIVFCIAVLIKCIRTKEYKTIGGFLWKFIAGCCIIVAPLVIWLAAKGALKACYEQFILFNLKYSDSDAILRSYAMMDMLQLPYFSVVFVVSVLLIVILYRKKQSIPVIFFPFALYFIFQSILFVMAGTFYDHYCITAVPFIVYPLSELLIALDDTKKKNIWLGLIALSLIAVSCVRLERTFVYLRYYLNGKYAMTQEVSDLIDCVKQNTNENSKITMFGNWDYMYIATDRESATIYTYAKPIIYLSREVYDDYFAKLNETHPDVLVLEFSNEDIEKFIQNNSYSIIYESENYTALKKGE